MSVSRQLVVFFTFFNKFQPAFLVQVSNNSSVFNSTLTIFSQKQFYVTFGDSVTVNCSYSFATKYSSKLNCAGLFWEWDGGRLVNSSQTRSECVSVLHIEKVLWLGKRNFRCMYLGGGINGKSTVEKKSLAVISTYKPKPISKPTVQWIEDEAEVTWFPTNDKKVMNYTVEYYCTPAEYLCNQNFVPGNCGYFRLNNCSEKTFHCRASFLVILGKNYTIRVISENKFGRQSSENVKMNIPHSQKKMMFKPVSELTVFPTRQAVKIKWKSVPGYNQGRKKIWYRCQGNKITHENFTRNDVYEILQDRLPFFKYCVFCVSRQKSQEDDNFSCATCKSIRTADGVPLATANFISCPLHGCPTVSSGNFRNVTLSWRLPEKMSWNGLITRQKIYYYEENDRVLHNITIKAGNITTWTVGKLKYFVGYFMFMVICTTAGCSDPSKTIYISAQTGEVQFTLFFKTEVLIGVPLAILGVCFVIICIILYLKRHEGERLPTIQEPDLKASTGRLSQSSNVEEYNVLRENWEEMDDFNSNSVL